MDVKPYTLPNYLQKLPSFRNTSNWVYVKQSGNSKVVAPAGIAIMLEGLRVMGVDKGHFHSLHVHSRAMGLQATPFRRAVNNFDFKDQVSTIEGGHIRFQVHNAIVHILDIKITPRKDAEDVEAGLYKATYYKDEERWNLQPVEKITTKFAGVNGIADNAGHAARIIQSVIPEGFPVGSGSIEQEGFTLYYNPPQNLKERMKGLGGIWRRTTGIAKKSDDAMNLASAMKDASDAKQEVRWSVHENGAETFIGAMRVLKERNIKLESQRAYYVNPTSNLIAAERYGKSVGMGIGDNNKSHSTKVLSLRQAYFGGNLAGHVWMTAAHTQGNIVDKISGAGSAAAASLASAVMYTSIGFSIGSSSLVGTLAVPTAAKSVPTWFASTTLAAGAIGWFTAITGVVANVGYKRYDSNSKANPFASVFGKQITC